MRELDPVGETDTLDGPLDFAAIGALARLISGTNAFPWQGTQLVVEFGLVCLDGKGEVGFSGVQVFGMFTLRVQGVGGDDDATEILDTFQ